tara:strand:- start:606 stop:911 length:306 start_codon:yes stop_codon:yes gene_type:complete
MLVESFLLMRKVNQLQKQKQEIISKENYVTDQGVDVDVKGLSTLIIVFMVIAIVMFALSIWALIDASRNCGDQKILHILLLIFIPAYLPVYFILRVSGTIC